MNSLAWFRRFRAAAWLGWQVESNWTDPFLFTLGQYDMLFICFGFLDQLEFKHLRGNDCGPKRNDFFCELCNVHIFLKHFQGLSYLPIIIG